MALTQEKIVSKIDKLTSISYNFPSLIKEAEAMAIINRVEKDAILTKYKTLYDKLTTFYLLAASKGVESLAKIPELLELTGNESAAQFLLEEEQDDISSNKHSTQDSCQQILGNLDRLCSHTINIAAVLSYATGLELITGTEREMIEKQCRSEEEQLEAFYAFVASKGASSVQKLVQVLTMTNNFWALEVVQHEEA